MSTHLLFLSHSGADTQAALALARRIEQTPEAQQQELRVWIDRNDLVAGGRWKDQLQDALARSTAFAVYVGSRGVVNWVWDEVSVALDRVHQEPGYPVIPILAPGTAVAALPSFLTQFQGIQDPEGNPDAFSNLLRGALRLEARTRVAAEAHPFVGLEAFDSRRAHLFFGRESETQGVLDLLRREHLVMVVGDSGSGKSSLLKAGVVPGFLGGALRRDRTDGPDDTVWAVLEMRPLSRPFENLADAALMVSQAAGHSPAKSSELAALVRTRKAGAVRDAIRMTAGEGVKVLVVVDQFEELFTLAAPSEQATFAQALLALGESSEDSIRVALTMRWDYYHLCSLLPALYARLEANDRRSRYPLGRISREGLTRTVIEPLRLAGMAAPVRDLLASAVARDVGDRRNDLALIEMALQQAWVKRADHGGDLLSAYVAIGRVEGALATAADEALEKHLTPEEKARAEALFIRLVKLGDTGGATRRVATREELDGGRWALAQKLATRECHRLVLVSEDTVEVSHEALVVSWPRYVAWFRNDPAKQDLRADDKRVLDALVDEAGRWASAPEEPPTAGLLAHGYDLERYESLARRRPAWLCARENEFVAASNKERHAEERRRREDAQRVVDERDRATKERRKAVRRARWLAGVSAGMLVALGWGYHQYFQANSALAASQLRRGLDLAALGDLDEALVFLAAAARVNANSPVVQIALLDSMVRAPRLVSELRHEGAVSSAAFSSDGTRVVTASRDGTARVWDVATGQAVGTALRHERGVYSAAFSADGTRVVTASEDWTARVWDAATGEVVSTLGHQDKVYSATFSADGTQVVTASEDRSARVWEAATGKAVGAELPGFRAVRSARFSADGTWVVTASENGTARVWKAATGQAGVPSPEDGRTGEIVITTDRTQSLLAFDDGTQWVAALDKKNGTVRYWDSTTGQVMGALLRHEGEGAAVNSAEFSADGTRVVTATSDGTARVWEPATGRVLGTLRHEGAVYSATFSVDGTRVVTASEDGTARVWEPATGRVVGTLRHEGAVYSATFSADGTRVVTASEDGTARVWDAATGQAVGAPLRHEGAVYSAGFNAEGTRVVTASEDGAARVWDAAPGQAVGARLRSNSEFLSATFSANGTRVVTVSEEGAAQVWDAATGLAVYPRHFGFGVDWVRWATFSADGTRVVTASEYGTAQVGEAATGQAVGAPLRHEGTVTSAAFSSDGTLVVTASENGTARVWDVATGEAVGTALRHEGGVTSAAVSADGTRVVTASENGTARVWDVATGRAVGAPLRHKRGVTSAAFSADGTRVVTASKDDTARVWEAATGQAVGAPLRHEGTVTSAAFSSDGTLVVTASKETVQVWEAATGQTVGAPLRHEGTVTSAAFSADGTRVVTASRNDTARVWDLLPNGVGATDLLMEAAEIISGRRLNSTQAVEPTTNRGQRQADLVRRVRGGSSGQSDTAAFLRWVLADRWSRTISPTSSIAVPEYITERLKTCQDRAWQEVQRAFLGHPLLRRRAEFCPVEATRVRGAGDAQQ